MMQSRLLRACASAGDQRLQWMKVAIHVLDGINRALAAQLRQEKEEGEEEGGY